MKKKVVDKVTKMNALLAEFHHICKSGIYSDTWPGWPDLLNDLYHTNKIFLKAYHLLFSFFVIGIFLIGPS